MTTEQEIDNAEHNRAIAFAGLCEQTWNQTHGIQEHWGTRDRITKELWTTIVKNTIAVVTRDPKFWLVASWGDEPYMEPIETVQETELSVLREIRDFLKAPIPGRGRGYPWHHG